MKNRSFQLIVLLLTLLISFPASAQAGKQRVNDTTYMLTYDHGGLILWGSDHFRERLQNAVEWLDKYKSFKIGLDNEAYIYDYLGENEPQLIDEIKGYLQKYHGRFAIGSSTYGQPLSQFINDESNVRQISYALAAEKKYFNYRPPVYLMSDDKGDSHSPFVHEEKLRFKMFPAVDTSGTGIRDLPFAIAETKNKYVEGNYWTAFSDGQSGIAYFNKGSMGSVREKDGSFSIPLAYSMYYVWGTRILYGPFSYEFALLPFSGDWREADLHRLAMEYSFLPETLQTSPGTGRMGSNIEKIKIAADRDVIMTALYPENGQVVTRFFKSSDSGKTSTVAIKIGGSQLVETRLDGKVIGDVNGKTMLKAWEIKTFRMK